MSADGAGFTMATAYSGPVVNTAKIAPAASKRPSSRNHEAYNKVAAAPGHGRSSSALGAVGGAASAEGDAAVNGEKADEDEDLDQLGGEAKAIVGYIGSIELPGNHNR
jgi:hypothetical protein